MSNKTKRDAIRERRLQYEADQNAKQSKWINGGPVIYDGDPFLVRAAMTVAGMFDMMFRFPWLGVMIMWEELVIMFRYCGTWEDTIIRLFFFHASIILFLLITVFATPICIVWAVAVRIGIEWGHFAEWAWKKKGGSH